MIDGRVGAKGGGASKASKAPARSTTAAPGRSTGNRNAGYTTPAGARAEATAKPAAAAPKIKPGGGTGISSRSANNARPPAATPAAAPATRPFSQKAANTAASGRMSAAAERGSGTAPIQKSIKGTAQYAQTNFDRTGMSPSKAADIETGRGWVLGGRQVAATRAGTAMTDFSNLPGDKGFNATTGIAKLNTGATGTPSVAGAAASRRMTAQAGGDGWTPSVASNRPPPANVNAVTGNNTYMGYQREKQTGFGVPL